jgi:hypothetical protein
MSLTARSNTRQRRATIERHARAQTIADLRDNLPLPVRVAHAICQSTYGYSKCACAKAPDKSTCEMMEGCARHVIDIIRRFDAKAAEERAKAAGILVREIS